MKTVAIATVFAALNCLHAAELKTSVIEQNGPKVQIALLLDTSGSMSGLIDQARTQLWKVVNEFAMSEQDGKRPDLQVALYEYGKSSIPASEGYIRMIVPLSTDLDKVSEELFALKTNGGDEYCGHVIQTATNSLGWGKSNKDYRAIFIAGNEPFTQGSVDYREACKAAISKGIVVNTIFCGNDQEGVNSNWKDGSLLADGSYMSINHNKEVIAVSAPQDKDISRLGLDLNKTYIPFGALGAANKKRQEEQEANTQSAGQGSFVQRQLSKATPYYRNEEWDLVDALKEGKLDLEKVKPAALPKEMQKMTAEERKSHVEKMTKQRAEIQSQINKLNDERRKYIAQERKALAEKGEDTLDAVLIKTVREQAGKKSYTFK